MDGDLKKILEAKAPNNNLMHTHLMSKDTNFLACHVLMLKIISAQDFNPENPADLNFLWDVRYNLDWPESTTKRFLILLKELLDGTLPTNVCIPQPSHLQSLWAVWSAWYSTASKSKSQSEFLLKKAQQERYSKFCYAIH